MIESPILVNDDLILKIYTYGREPKGECILFTIGIKNKIFFSGLIDAFFTKNDELIEIMKKNNITELNYICLTHPDYDHCYGIEYILDKITDKTKIAFPVYMIDEKYLEKYSDKVREELNKIRQKIKDRKLITYNCSENQIIVDEKMFRDKNGQIYSLKINTIYPFSSVVGLDNLKVEDGDKQLGSIINNNYSVVNLITFGDIELFLGSDVDNRSIDLINGVYRTDSISKFFENIIYYLKIPHHSSPHSSKLLSLLNYEEKVENAVTTVFRSSRLPDLNILKQYQEVSNHLHSTGPLMEKGKENFGIVEIEFNLSTKEIMYNYSGEALEISNIV